MTLIISLALGTPVGGLLYRLRGGLLKRWINSTHACRAVWALPTGLLMYFLAGGPLWLAPALVVSVFASMALYGHGAHMVYDTDFFIKHVKSKTELLTSWWLPGVFGGIPDATWDHQRATMYNVVGMSFIGLVRNFTAVAPLLFSHPLPSAAFGLSGLLHGPLYWAGWRIRGGGIQAAEVLVGSVTWATIILLFS